MKVWVKAQALRMVRWSCAGLVVGALQAGSLASLGALSIGSATAGETLSGEATVIDGDTIEIHGQRFRLHGIDAPESKQTCIAGGKKYRCGQQASLALSDKIKRRSVSCEERDRDRYKRIVAVCSAGNVDLNAWMVSQGWAVAYRHYSKDYVKQEQAAAAKSIGMWGGEFVLPWDWRRGKRLPASKVGRSNEDARDRKKQVQCLIKGNISRKGERIYHVPGGQYYSRTKITVSKGERMFCSEGEARAAGWRRSKR
jgi:endonuclease YncB( thermonuclease family)